MHPSFRLFGWLIPVILCPQLSGVEGIMPDFLVHQEDSPLQVISVAVSADRQDLLDGAILANIGGKTVASYTLGWLFEETATGRKAGPFVGRTTDATIRPGDAYLAPAQGVSFRDGFRLLRSQGLGASRLIVGVVQVAFTDGSEWNYPLLREGQFREKKDPLIEAKLRPILERHRRITENLASRVAGGE